VLLDAIELQLAIPRRWERSSTVEDLISSQLFASGCGLLRDAVENGHVDPQDARTRLGGALRRSWRQSIVRIAKRERGQLIHWWSEGLQGRGPFGPRSVWLGFLSPFFGSDKRAFFARHPDYVITCSRVVDAIERLEFDADRDGSGSFAAVMGEGWNRHLSLLGLPLVFDSLQRTDAQCALARVGLAVAIHRQEAGAYPESLDELAPLFPEGVPGDLFSGGPFKYERVDDGVRIYSVGDAEIRTAADGPMVERRDRYLMWELR
jgi:hypothetical protein